MRREKGKGISKWQWQEKQLEIDDRNTEYRSQNSEEDLNSS